MSNVTEGATVIELKTEAEERVDHLEHLVTRWRNLNIGIAVILAALLWYRTRPVEPKPPSARQLHRAMAAYLVERYEHDYHLPSETPEFRVWSERALGAFDNGLTSGGD